MILACIICGAMRLAGSLFCQDCEKKINDSRRTKIN